MITNELHRRITSYNVCYTKLLRPSVLHVSLLYLLGIVMITLPFGIDEAAWFPALLKLLATLLFIILTSRLLLRLSYNFV